MNIKIDLIDGCSKNEEEMCFWKKGLAAFKKKILIKNRTEIWLCSLLVCQECNPAKYAIYRAGTFRFHFLEPWCIPWFYTWNRLTFRQIKKHTSHLLNELICTNHWLCTKDIQILLIHYIIPLSLNHSGQLNHHLGHLSPSDTEAEWRRWMVVSLRAGNEASGTACGTWSESDTIGIRCRW